VLKVQNNLNDQNKFEIHVGDTIAVSSRIKEDNRTRVQKFEGLVIAIKGSGMGKTFTVRRIGVNDVGVERIFPVFSPLIEKIEVVRPGKVRRAKLYYLRDRKGKSAIYVRSGKKVASV
jgi:large subunit ribosomal protein L19